MINNESSIENDENNASSVLENHESELCTAKSTGSACELRIEEVENVETDRYGFYITDRNRRGADMSKAEAKKQKSKETERTRKWVKMVKEWDHVTRDKPEKLKRRIRKGVPDILRGKVWTDIALISEYKQKFPNALLTSNSTLNQIIIDEIDRDLDRTFPRHEYFVRKSGRGQEALRRILQSYVCLDPETGYCQGMGFIAAMFLIYMVEEDAFYCLVSAMQRPLAPLRQMFMPNFILAQRMMATYWSLLEEEFPRLHSHLTHENLHPSMFATEWFLTIFSRSFPFDLVTRVWDVFWAEGYKIIYRVALALLKWREKELRSSSFEDIMKILREIPGTVNVPKVMEIAWAIPIKTSQIKRLEDMHERQAVRGAHI